MKEANVNEINLNFLKTNKKYFTYSVLNKRLLY